MRRDPEQVYRVKPEVSAPLFDDCKHERNYELPVTGAKVCLDCPNVEVAHARRTDPRTSHEAAASVRNITKTRNSILYLLRCGKLTDEQIAGEYARLQQNHGEAVYPTVSPSGLRSRRAELVAMGLVEACGESKTRSGRSCQLWRVK